MYPKVCIYIYIYIYIYICIWLIQEGPSIIYLSIYLSIYQNIYIYRERERGREYLQWPQSIPCIGPCLAIRGTVSAARALGVGRVSESELPYKATKELLLKV